MFSKTLFSGVMVGLMALSGISHAQVPKSPGIAPPPDSAAFLLTSSEVISKVKDLEQNPLSAQSDQERKDLIAWVQQAPDVTVNICGTAAPMVVKDEPFSELLFGQMLFSNASYQLENPSKHNEFDNQKAGIEGMLKVYEKIKASHPSARQPYAEALELVKQNNLLPELIQRTCIIPEKKEKSGTI